MRPGRQVFRGLSDGDTVTVSSEESTWDGRRGTVRHRLPGNKFMVKLVDGPSLPFHAHELARG